MCELDDGAGDEDEDSDHRLRKLFIKHFRPIKTGCLHSALLIAANAQLRLRAKTHFFNSYNPETNNKFN